MIIFVELKFHKMSQLLKTKGKLHLNLRSEKICVVCEEKFMGTIVQVTCSEKCRKIKNNRSIEKFHKNNPNMMKVYNKNRVNKNPDVWKEKWNSGREEIIIKLGGVCSVPECNVTKHTWLHIDYIPTMIGSKYRHPRHKRWVLDNIKDFRLLCANHHYELTLTGEIEGTNIKQKNRKDNIKI